MLNLSRFLAQLDIHPFCECGPRALCTRSGDHLYSLYGYEFLGFQYFFLFMVYVQALSLCTFHGHVNCWLPEAKIIPDYNAIKLLQCDSFAVYHPTCQNPIFCKYTTLKVI